MRPYLAEMNDKLLYMEQMNWTILDYKDNILNH